MRNEDIKKELMRLKDKPVEEMTVPEILDYSRIMQNTFGRKEDIDRLQQSVLLAKNPADDGYDKGTPHKEIFKNNGINHQKAHLAMQELLWIMRSRKEVTVAGAKKAFDKAEIRPHDVPTFYVRNGSIYWNTDCPNFEKILQEVKDHKLKCGKKVSSYRYNDMLKATGSILNEATLCKCAVSGMSILDSDEIDITQLYLDMAKMKSINDEEDNDSDD